MSQLQVRDVIYRVNIPRQVQARRRAVGQQ